MINADPTPISTAKLAAISALNGSLPQKLLNITPILHPQNGFHPEHSRTFWSAVANALYIVRQDGYDRFGRTPNFSAELDTCPDLVAHGRRGPISAGENSLTGLHLWRAAEKRLSMIGRTLPSHGMWWAGCHQSRMLSGGASWFALFSIILFYVESLRIG